MIYSYMELSTANLSPKTAMWLDCAILNPENNSYPAVTPKDGYGYYIPVSKDMADEYPDIPEDLKIIIRYACENNCNYLVIDSDAKVDPVLHDFSSEWNDGESMAAYTDFRKKHGLNGNSRPADKDSLTDQLNALKEKLMDTYGMSHNCRMADAIDHIAAAENCIRNS